MHIYHAPRRGRKIRPAGSLPHAASPVIERMRQMGFVLSGGGFPNGQCRQAIYGCAMRIATLAEDGTPDGFVYITDQLITLTIDPQYETGTESNVKNACATLIGTAKGPDEFKRLNLNLEITTPDPEIYDMLLNGTLLTSAGESVGFAIPAVGALQSDGVSLEIWAKSWVGDAQAANFPYVRFVFPRTNNWKLGSRTIDENFSANILVGEGIENENFFDGPGNDLVSGEHVTAMQHVYDDAIPDTACGRSVLTGS